VKNPHALGGVTGKAQSTRVVAVGVDGSNEETVLEKPGSWSVCDWSPDGNRLLLLYQPSLAPRYGSGDLVEFDLAAAAKTRELAPPGTDFASGPGVDEHLKSLTAGLDVRFFLEGRYSPDGKQIATTLSRHQKNPGSPFGPKGIEVGVLTIASGKLRTIARGGDGTRGPVCWSPGGAEILFSRPLPEKDKREKWLEPGSGGLGIWAVRSDGTGERFVTTGWCPDWR
jgi:hypothetical protein